MSNIYFSFQDMQKVNTPNQGTLMLKTLSQPFLGF